MAAVSAHANSSPVDADMVTPDRGASAYVLGHSDRELERLRLQAQLIDPITRQFLIEAGIAPGMRVLDVGSGAGDVTFLADHWSGLPGRSWASIDPPPVWLWLERALIASRLPT